MKTETKIKIKNQTTVTYVGGNEDYLMANYDIEFHLQQVVYLKTDENQMERIVTGINLRPSNQITYGLSLVGNDTWHYGFEITSDRDIVKVTSS